MKIQRPGHTESHLLWQSYLRKTRSSDYDQNLEKQFTVWLYKTTGLYDKTIIDPKNSFDQIINSDIYNKWLYGYRQAINRSTHIDFWIGSPSFSDPACKSFINYVNSTYTADSISINGIIQHNTTIYDFDGYWYKDRQIDRVGVFNKHYNMLENKNVIVISPFSELIEYQYKNNIHKIFPKFPRFKKLQTYKIPYTFLNYGPDNNFFETLNCIQNDISKIDFDIALLSCGTYATFLIDYIDRILNLDAFYMGRGCNAMFGIDPNKNENQYPLWITKIPDHLIYSRANEIEDGIYWGKLT